MSDEELKRKDVVEAMDDYSEVMEGDNEDKIVADLEKILEVEEFE